MIHLNRSSVKAGAWGLALAVALAVGPAALWAEDLPKGDAIVDKYIKVTGGKAAYDALKNSVTKGQIEIVGQGMKLTMTAWAAPPNNVYAVIESDAVGKIERGVSGDVVWENSVMTGPVVKEGEEKYIRLRSAAFDGVQNWRKLYKKAECTGTEEVDGKKCYKVVMTPNQGSPETRYYDAESGLLLELAMTLELPMGEIPIEVFMSDYRKVDGVLMAHKTKQVVADMQETLIVMESIKHNVDIPKDKFDLPADVKALLEKEEGEEEEEEEGEEGEDD